MATSTDYIGPDKETDIFLSDVELTDPSSDLAPATLSSAYGDGQAIKSEDVGGDQCYATGLELAAVVLPMTLIAFLAFLDGAILATAVASITDDFHTIRDIGWYGSAYRLANAVMAPLTGPIYRQFSSKWTLLVFFALFELGSILCGAAPSSGLFILGRTIAGVGGAGISNGSMVIVAALVPLERRPAIIALIAGILQIGGIAGPMLGGVITEYLSWRWVFFLNPPIGGIAALILILRPIPDQVAKPPAMVVIRHLHRYLDLIGFILCATASICLLLALDLAGGKEGWENPSVAVLLLTSGLGAVSFGLWSIFKGGAALVPTQVLSLRPVWAAALTYMALNGAVSVVAFFLPLFFQVVSGATPIQSGLWMVPSTFLFAVFAIFFNILIGKKGFFQSVLLFGNSIHITATLLLATFTPTTSVAAFILCQCLGALGRGAILAAPTTAVQASLPLSEVSFGQGLLALTGTLGSSLAITAGNTIFRGGLKDRLTESGSAIDHGMVETILDGSATEFRRLLPSDKMEFVLQAYARSVDTAFIWGAGLASVGMIVSFAMGRIDVRKDKGQYQRLSEDDRS